MLSDRLRAMTGGHWIALFAVILASWGALYLMAVPADLRVMGRLYGADFWESLCVVTPDAAGFARVAGMWALMAAGMMAPTALPSFATYDDLRRTGTPVNFAALVGGYLVIWLGFAALAAATQIGLYSVGLVGVLGQSQSVVLSAGLLAGAGLYQFSPLKDACLSKCRAPLTFFMAHWDEGPWRMGLRLGAVCLGCCWALMLLALVGGVMNLAFMALAMALMVVEKLPGPGRYLTRPLGAALLGGAVWMAATAMMI
ncbi:Predicted metal-binding integral membrane protein [Salinihabitans flavidus]|uniref:Predicted metal-binding integral membrane protein n=1 Tax=Salinihabitans flavidus TaxID=569882 RepID=A0A1H8TC38_9RHOB|nr:DUF2182 domain-containing protein [Salinihabitans flavidus]SEO88699.1 Predicted metal-binding integral membrane protein [Salinihabitans flavidus]